MRLANVELAPGMILRTPYEPDGGAPSNLDLATPRRMGRRRVRPCGRLKWQRAREEDARAIGSVFYVEMTMPSGARRRG